MQRREFIASLAGVALGPLAARGQKAVPVVGFLCSGTSDAFAAYAAAFREGLAETAYTDGRNVTIAYRWADGQADRLPELAAGLVAQRVAVIAATGGIEPAQSARAATTSLPIVFVGSGDAVNAGLVKSFARPGGNVTGIALPTTGLGTRRLGLLVQFVPRAQAIGYLANLDNPGSEPEWRDIQEAARLRGKQTLIVKASSAADLEPAFAALVRQRAGAVIVAGDPVLDGLREEVVALAARYALPAMYLTHDAVAAGGLLGYGPNITDAYRQGGIYCGRILAGEKPAELPVMRADLYELAINLGTAKALGLDMPPGLVAIADEVIE
jgi:putative tryptophan/tyrosine transport system substrate-binding protein